MNDTIYRQAAIDALAGMHCKYDEDGYVWIIRSDAWARIDALPSAQPEQHYDEWCDSCKEYDQEKHCCPRWNRVIKSTVEELKAAQPEIIRCKDCKYWREYKYVNGKPKFLPKCGFNDIYTRESDFCSRAERRTDE